MITRFSLAGMAFLWLAIFSTVPLHAELIELPKYGFAVDIPDDWNVEKNQHRQTALTATNAKGNVSVIMSSYKMDTSIPDQAMVRAQESVASSLKAHGHQGEVKWETNKIGELTWNWTTAPVMNGSATAYVYIAMSDTRIYSLNFNLAKGATFSAETEVILKSFKVMPQGG